MRGQNVYVDTLVPVNKFIPVYSIIPCHPTDWCLYSLFAQVHLLQLMRFRVTVVMQLCSSDMGGGGGLHLLQLL